MEGRGKLTGKCLAEGHSAKDLLDVLRLLGRTGLLSQCAARTGRGRSGLNRALCRRHQEYGSGVASAWRARMRSLKGWVITRASGLTGFPGVPPVRLLRRMLSRDGEGCSKSVSGFQGCVVCHQEARSGTKSNQGDNINRNPITHLFLGLRHAGMTGLSMPLAKPCRSPARRISSSYAASHHYAGSMLEPLKNILSLPKFQGEGRSEGEAGHIDFSNEGYVHIVSS